MTGSVGFSNSSLLMCSPELRKFPVSCHVHCDLNLKYNICRSPTYVDTEKVGKVGILVYLVFFRKDSLGQTQCEQNKENEFVHFL